MRTNTRARLAGAADASHVHEDARGAVGGSGLVDGGLHAGGVGDVAGAGHATNVCSDFFGQLGIAVEHRHPGAQARQFARCGADLNANTGTFDDNDVVILIRLVPGVLLFGPGPGGGWLF